MAVGRHWPWKRRSSPHPCLPRSALETGIAACFTAPEPQLWRRARWIGPLLLRRASEGKRCLSSLFSPRNRQLEPQLRSSVAVAIRTDLFSAVGMGPPRTEGGQPSHFRRYFMVYAIFLIPMLLGLSIVFNFRDSRHVISRVAKSPNGRSNYGVTLLAGWICLLLSLYVYVGELVRFASR